MKSFENNIRDFTNLVAMKIIPEDMNNSDNLEVISYGVCALLTSILNITFSGISLSIFNKLNDYLIFLCFFIPIRCLHNGFHCKTLLNCLFLTNFLFTITVLMCPILFYIKYIHFCFLIILFCHYYISYEHRFVFHIYLIIIYIFINIVCPQKLPFLIAALILNIILMGGGRVYEKNITK